MCPNCNEAGHLKLRDWFADIPCWYCDNCKKYCKKKGL